MKTANLYTDGACSTNGTWDGGAGLYVELNQYEEHFYMAQVETTNNVMELEAFLYALKYSYYNLDTDYDIKILTDSAYIVNCLKQQWYKKWQSNGWRTAKKDPVKNKHIWEEILEYLGKTCFHTIEVIKVKGHSGDRGNGIADQLAVAGRDLGKYQEWEEFKDEIKQLYN